MGQSRTHPPTLLRLLPRLIEKLPPESPKMSNAVFVNSPTIRDPAARLAPEGQHSLEILVGASYAAFERWAHLPAGERGEGYEAFVKGLGDELISTVERYIPQLSQNTCGSSNTSRH